MWIVNVVIFDSGGLRSRGLLNNTDKRGLRGINEKIKPFFTFLFINISHSIFEILTPAGHTHSVLELDGFLRIVRSKGIQSRMARSDQVYGCRKMTLPSGLNWLSYFETKFAPWTMDRKIGTLRFLTI